LPEFLFFRQLYLGLQFKELGLERPVVDLGQQLSLFHPFAF
jgi:hypothetical protein